MINNNTKGQAMNVHTRPNPIPKSVASSISVSFKSHMKKIPKDIARNPPIPKYMIDKSIRIMLTVVLLLHLLQADSQKNLWLNSQ